MSMQPFTYQGKTIKVSANVSAPAPVRCIAGGSLNVATYRVANPEANETIWYTMNVDPVAALADAVIPTGGGSSATNAVPLPAGGVEVVRGPAGAYFSGVTRTAAANLFVTPGDGI